MLPIFNILNQTKENYTSSNEVAKYHKPFYHNFVNDNPEIKILNTDKNLGCIALDLNNYHQMVMKHLSNIQIYEVVDENLNNYSMFLKAYSLAKANYDKLIKYYENKNYLDSKERKPLKDFSKSNLAVIPNFHVLPKLHKWNLVDKIIPSRPIIGAINWYTTPISKLISRNLQPIIKSRNHVAINSKQVTDSLRNIKLPGNCFLITLDVRSLYTNIKLDLLKTLFIGNPILERSINFINNNNYFTYCGKNYKQKDGLAMGTNCAPDLANYFLAEFLDPTILDSNLSSFYTRYLDDLFLIWNGSKAEFESFFIKLDNLVDGIKFDYTISNSTVDFLDLKINLDCHGNISFQTHQKLLNKYCYISPSSCHPQHTLSGFIFAELNRYKTNSSSYYFYVTTKNLFYKRLLQRGYRHSFLLPIFNKHRYTSPDKEKVDNPILNLSIRYSKRQRITKFTSKVKKLIQPEIHRYLPSQLIISWKRSKNIFGYLSRSALTSEQIKLLTARVNL